MKKVALTDSAPIFLVRPTNDGCTVHIYIASKFEGGTLKYLSAACRIMRR